MTDKTDTGARAVGNVVTGEPQADNLIAATIGATGTESVGEARTPGVTSKASWRDWLPEGEDGPTDDELITRAELLAQLRDADVDLAERTLQTWESQGIMPGPVRRWHDGATRAMYAPWVVSLGRYADHMKNYGDDPELLSKMVRGMVRMAIGNYGVWKGAMADGRLAASLQDLAERFETRSGEHPDLIKLQMCRADGGHWQVYTYKVRPTAEPAD